MTRRFPVEFSLSPGSCILGALMLLILPLELLLSAFLAAAIHEVCHLLALLACKAPIFQIKVGVSGAVIRTAPLPPLQELLCALAGPVGSMLCLLFVRQFPLLALCGFFQGLYNFLPIHPLDGGRILHCTAQLCFPRYAKMVSDLAGWCVYTLVTLGSIFLLFHTKDVIFLVLGGFFLSRVLPGRKTPCKDGAHWVQ